MLGQVQTRGRKWRDVDAWPHARTFQGILVFEFQGPLFFASAEFFQEELERFRVKAEAHDARPLSIVVISLESVHYLDSTAVRILEDVLTQWQKIGISCIISGAQNQVRLLIEEKLVRIRREAGLPSVLDQSAFMITVSDAVDQARQRFAAREGHACGWTRAEVAAKNFSDSDKMYVQSSMESEEGSKAKNFSDLDKMYVQTSMESEDGSKVIGC